MTQQVKSTNIPCTRYGMTIFYKDGTREYILASKVKKEGEFVIFFFGNKIIKKIPIEKVLEIYL